MATRTARTRKHAAPLLPAGLADLLKRRGLQGLGGVMVLGGLALMLALVSYRASDASWHTATGGVPENLLGRTGASLAQVLWMFGWCGPVPAVALITWGGQIMRWLSLDRLRWRLLAVIAVMVTGPGGTTALLGRPLATGDVGLGGSVGYFLANHIETATAAVGLPAWVLAVPLIGISLALMPFALGLPLEDMRAIGGAVLRAGRWLWRAATTTLADAVRWISWRIEALRVALPATSRGQTRRAHRRDTGAAAPLMPNMARDAEPPDPDPAGPDRAERRIGEPEVAEILGKSAPRPGARESRERQGTLRLGEDEAASLPPLDLLEAPETSPATRNSDAGALQKNARLLESVLDDFGVHGNILRGRNGPVVTRYELVPAPGTRSSRVISLADDIARSMSAVSARVAVVPGQNAIGIELPNRSRETVYLRELLASEAFERSNAALPLVLGKDISGEPSVVDLARMPHLLVAGTTGSGKSVAINSMILSLVYRLRADECKFIMIDPKMLELSVYDGIPHLLHPVVVDPNKAVVALKWAVKEMNARYRLMSNLNVRNIAGYNKRLAQARAKGEELTKTVQTGFHPETGKPMYEKQAMDMDPLPLLVIVVDEMADLMLVAGKDIEVAVQSLAQKARAAGIHLIIATQRPSVDVITGTIKANLPTRISFQVTSKIDSRTILGEQGAEQLLGMGDMLYMAGGSQIHRVHGPYVSEEEVEEVANFLRTQGEPQYLESITDDIEESAAAAGGLPAAGSGDALFDQAVALVARERKASTSFVQRHLQIGYNRAARLIERMEAEGMISKANHVGKREVLLPEYNDVP